MNKYWSYFKQCFPNPENVVIIDQHIPLIWSVLLDYDDNDYKRKRHRGQTFWLKCCCFQPSRKRGGESASEKKLHNKEKASFLSLVKICQYLLLGAQFCSFFKVPPLPVSLQTTQSWGNRKMLSKITGGSWRANYVPEWSLDGILLVLCALSYVISQSYCCIKFSQSFMLRVFAVKGMVQFGIRYHPFCQ